MVCVDASTRPARVEAGDAVTLQLETVALGHPELADLDPAERRLALRALARRSPDADVAAVVRRLSDDIDGFGPVSDLLRDERVSDVLINGPNEIWVERAGRLDRVDIRFDGSHHLDAFVDRLLMLAGARADASEPVADGRLPDGSRLHVVLQPVAPRGPLVSIRRFPKAAWSLRDLVERTMLTDVEAEALRSWVVARRTVVIAGGTGAGKTTLLNALLDEVPESERVVTIEETPELAPGCLHHVSLVARPPNVEGLGGADVPTLLRAALRMRPDRIVVGEVRGPEALVALAAMSTGHPGSLLTVHASSAGAATERLVGLALQDPSAPSESSLRSLMHSAIEVVVYLERIDGGRKITDIVEI